MPANQRRLAEEQRGNIRRAARKTAAAFKAGKPDAARSLLAKTARPGIIIVEDGQIACLLVAKDVRLRCRILLHAAIRIEMVGINVSHDGDLRADGVRS